MKLELRDYDAKMAKEFTNIIPVFKQLGEAAKEAIK